MHSCLALPKVAFFHWTCPPDYIRQASMSFDEIIREVLADLVGSCLSDRAWLKASLPSSQGGLNIRRAFLHAPAASVGSLEQSRTLVTRILGQVPETHSRLVGVVSVLAVASARRDWVSIKDIDVAHQQHCLSCCIDEVSHHYLLVSAPNIHSRALALSSTLPHAGDCLMSFLPLPLVFISKIRNSSCVCLIGWA